MKQIYTIFAIVLFAVAIPSNAKAQDTWHSSKKIQFMVGANVMWEGGFISKTGKGRFGNWANYSISGEARFTNHSGLELDIALRDNNFISIPILYKFYSRILNFTLGVNVDLPLGRTHYIENYNGIGFVLRLTKDIKIYKGLYVEPLIQFNPMINLKSNGSLNSYMPIFSAGAGIKYRF